MDFATIFLGVSIFSVFVAIFRLLVKLRTPIPATELCYTCLDNAADAMLLDCGHKGICLICAMRIERRCPLCRGIVRGVVLSHLPESAASSE